MELRRPRGTNDILPGEVERWQRLENVVRTVFDRHGYAEIRLPIFEHTEVFIRGVGETTDIVEKQMYTFEDQGGRSLTLRPEGTAPVVRAYLEHKLHGRGLPAKLYYIGPMFRYERPQAGRYRQFHQFGAEAIGSDSALLDVEMMAIPVHIYRELGLKNFRIELNSIGCEVCRPAYRQALRDYLAARLDALCPTCVRRLERNPLRVLDCKEKSCIEASEGAPKSYEYLCAECGDHFAAVQQGLDALGLEYVVNYRLVRGLDYYTRTVFELVGLDLGAQDALGGGGRYDGLVEACGGPPTPAVGFAAGIERVLLSLEKLGIAREEPTLDAYVVVQGDTDRATALQLAFALRTAGLRVEMDYLNRSMRAQMRAAQRSGAVYTVILGENEIAAGTAVVKDMATGEQQEVPQERVVDVIQGGRHIG